MHYLAIHRLDTNCSLIHDFLLRHLDYYIHAGVFISNEGYDYANSPIYLSFHFAHMVILFIGLAFILQALLLTGLVASRKVIQLYLTLDIPAAQLSDNYT